MPTRKILLILFLAACHIKPKIPPPAPLRIDVLFAPAFSYEVSVHVKLVRSGDTSYLVDTSYRPARPDGSRPRVLHATDSLPMTAADWEILFHLRGPESLLYLTNTTERYMDGININGIIHVGEQQHQFHCQSPYRDKYSGNYAFFDALLTLLYRKLPGQEEWFERVQSYLDYSPFVRMKPGHPDTVRIYGSYSMEDMQQLDKLLHRLPAESAFVMDLRNVRVPYPWADSLFKAFRRTHRRSVWLPPPRQRIIE